MAHLASQLDGESLDLTVPLLELVNTPHNMPPRSTFNFQSQLTARRIFRRRIHSFHSRRSLREHPFIFKNIILKDPLPIFYSYLLACCRCLKPCLVEVPLATAEDFGGLVQGSVPATVRQPRGPVAELPVAQVPCSPLSQPHYLSLSLSCVWGLKPSSPQCCMPRLNWATDERGELNRELEAIQVTPST